MNEEDKVYQEELKNFINQCECSIKENEFLINHYKEVISLYERQNELTKQRIEFASKNIAK